MQNPENAYIGILSHVLFVQSNCDERIESLFSKQVWYKTSHRLLYLFVDTNETEISRETFARDVTTQLISINYHLNNKKCKLFQNFLILQ